MFLGPTLVGDAVVWRGNYVGITPQRIILHSLLFPSSCSHLDRVQMLIIQNMDGY